METTTSCELLSGVSGKKGGMICGSVGCHSLIIRQWMRCIKVAQVYGFQSLSSTGDIHDDSSKSQLCPYNENRRP